MLPICQQVMDALDRIDHKNKHDVTTDLSRKLASLQIRSHLNLFDRRETESSVILFVYAKLKEVKLTGYFGLWGQKGSFFVQEISKVLAATVRGLGLLSAEAMEKKLIKPKDKANKMAMQSFIHILNDENSTNDQIIQIAAELPFLSEFNQKVGQLQAAQTELTKQI